MNEEEKILSQIDSIEYERYYPYDKEKLYIEIAKIQEKRGVPKDNNTGIWEFNLLNKTFGYSGQINDRWKYIIDNLGKRPVFFPKSSSKSISYFSKRLKRSKNEIDKARYSYFLYITTSKEGYIQQSLSYFQGALDKYIKNNKFTKFYEIPPFCLKISIAIILWKSYREKVIGLFNRVVGYIQYKIDKGDKRWCLELIEELAQLLNYAKKEKIELDKNKLEQVIAIVDKNSDHYLNQSNFHLAQSYLKSKISFFNYLEDYEAIKQTRLKIASYYEKEAESRAEPIVKSSFYKDALDYYSNNKIITPQKENELKRLIRQNNEKITFKEIKINIDIPQEKINEYIKFLKQKPAKEILKELILDKSFIPKKSDVEKFVKELNKKHPLLSMIPITKIGSDGEISEIKKDKDLLEHQVLNQFGIHIQIFESVLLEIFDRLDQLNQDEIINFLKSNLKITDSLKSTIIEGIKKYFKENYSESIRILVLNLEGIIRQIAKNNDLETTIRQADGSIRLKTFGQLLNDPNVKKIFDDDLLLYLKIKYVNPDFQNIRNRLAHGLIRKDEINKKLSLSVIFTILKLCGV